MALLFGNAAEIASPAGLSVRSPCATPLHHRADAPLDASTDPRRRACRRYGLSRSWVRYSHIRLIRMFRGGHRGVDWTTVSPNYWCGGAGSMPARHRKRMQEQVWPRARRRSSRISRATSPSAVVTWTIDMLASPQSRACGSSMTTRWTRTTEPGFTGEHPVTVLPGTLRSTF